MSPSRPEVPVAGGPIGLEDYARATLNILEDFAAERYFREAKIMQIFEGTNQINRLHIVRGLLREAR